MQQRSRRRKKHPSCPVSLSLYEQGKSLHEIAVELGISDEQASCKLMRATERYTYDLHEQMHYHKTMLTELHEQHQLLVPTLIRMHQTPPT